MGTKVYFCELLPAQLGRGFLVGEEARVQMRATQQRRTSDVRTRSRRTAALPGAFPRERRSGRGVLRWYLVHTPEGLERPTAEKIKRIIPRDLLEDAFVISKERWVKRGGVWSVEVKPLYPEYVVVATRDAAALDRALSKLSFHVRVAGSEERAYQPMAAEAQAWLEAALDGQHVVRGSVAELVGGELRVVSGPLVGQEARVLRWDRRKRYALVDVGREGGGSVEALALDIPVKS